MQQFGASAGFGPLIIGWRVHARSHAVIYAVRRWLL